MVGRCENQVNSTNGKLETLRPGENGSHAQRSRLHGVAGLGPAIPTLTVLTLGLFAVACCRHSEYPYNNVSADFLTIDSQSRFCDHFDLRVLPKVCVAKKPFKSTRSLFTVHISMSLLNPAPIHDTVL